jgi:tetratricopeptide (TPR) repeat protein
MTEGADVSWLGEPVHRTILALDIEGSTRPERRDSDRLRMRAELYRRLEQVLDRAQIKRREYRCTDQGDGILILLSPEIPKTRVLPWLILRLAAGLNRYNRTATPRCRLRLRAVLHAGEVASDAHGHSSKDLNLTFRLLDSDALRRPLAEASTSLVLLVSQSIYDDIVRQGYRDIDATAFRPLRVVGNDTDAPAWLYLPGRHNDVDAGERPSGYDLATTPRSALLVPHELPADVLNFTGREAELARLLTTLTDKALASCPVVAMHGVGGVGKSALAVHAAHRLASRFPDGQLYVNLQGATAGLRPLSPGELVARLLRGLGVDGRDIPVEVEEAAARFRSLMAGRRVLLVLDNAVSAVQVRLLLPASPTCAAIVTSRQVLATLDGASQLHLDVLPPRQAIRLLGKFCGAMRLTAEPHATEDLARQCDYLPLALRIAGARLAGRPSWPVRALAERLADKRTRLDELELADLAVRSCFHVGYQALNGSADTRERQLARLFRLLGLHRGSDFGVWTAAALLKTSPTIAEAALEQLVDAQLLETPARHRYRMHSLLLLFAREQADRDEPEVERRAALRRMLDCYLATAHRGQRLLQPTAVGGSGWSVEAATPPLASRAEAFAWFEDERPNLLAAAHQAADGPAPFWDFTTRLAEVMFWFFKVRSYWRDSEEINHLALRVARQCGDRHGQALALNDLSYGYAGLGRLDRAVDCLEQSSRLFAEMKDPLWEHTSIGALGAVCRELGQLDQAVECLERSLRHCQQIGDNPSGESAALNNLGLTYSDQGRLADAIDCLQQSLTICIKTQNRFGEAVVISNLGEAHYRAGRLDTAIEFYERSLLIHREIGDRCREAETLWRLGWVQDALDQQAQAHACWNAAQAIFKELDVTPPTQQEFQRTVWW